MAAEKLSNGLVKKRLDGMVNVQAFCYVFLQELAYATAEIPEDGQSVLPNLETVHQWNHQLERLSFYASAREQAERSAASSLDPLAWVPFAQRGFRRLDRHMPGAGMFASAPIFTGRKRDIQGQVFADMIDHRVFAEGVSQDCTGREYALMAATGQIVMRATQAGSIAPIAYQARS
jgi:hypothetical protein